MVRQVFFGIKAQLSLTVVLVAMFCLGVLSVATYVSNKGTMVELRTSRLQTIAELKASQMMQAVNSMSGEVVLLSNRKSMQTIMTNFLESGGGSGVIGNQDSEGVRSFKWAIDATDDVVASAIYDKELNQVMSIAANQTEDLLQYIPDSLYPASYKSAGEIQNVTMSQYGINGFLVGPEMAEDKQHCFLSTTRRLTENTPALQSNRPANATPQGETIGYLTVILRAQPLLNVVGVEEDDGGDSDRDDDNEESYSTEFGAPSSLDDGDDSDMVVRLAELVGENGTLKLDEKDLDQFGIRMLFSSTGAWNETLASNQTTPLSEESALVFIDKDSGCVEKKDKYGPNLVNNEHYYVGYAPVEALNKRWAILVYQTQDQVYQPLHSLRNMILISIFSIGVGLCVATLILSGWLVRPIRRLQRATEDANPFLAEQKTPVRLWNKPWVKRPNDRHDESDSSSDDLDEDPMGKASSSSASDVVPPSRWRRYWVWFNDKILQRDIPSEQQKAKTLNGGGFQVPQQVMVRRRIKDELTDLTETFNEMTDELRKQYQILEDRVAEKTSEIESARVSAEMANESKSRFIANITHELRTPLNGVLGMAEVAMHQFDPEELRHSLCLIFSSGELLLHLLTDLLNYSRDSTVNLTLKEKEMMVTEILSQLNALFRTQSKSIQVDLKIELLSPELHEHVLYGDRNRIEQIVINLISNSLKFTPKGGKVTCKITGEFIPASGKSLQISDVSNQSSFEMNSTFTKHSLSTKESSHNMTDKDAYFNEKDDSDDDDEDDDENDSDDKTFNEKEFNNGHKDKVEEEKLPAQFNGHDIMMVYFQVQDTGPGIAPHMQAKIFEPFVQGELQFTERRAGAGLGLSICKQLATMMHGNVFMESELGKGSTFTFKVPLRIIRGADKAAFTNLLNIENWAAVGESIYEQTDTPNEELPPSSSNAPKPRPPMSRNNSSLGSSSGEERKIDFPVKILLAEDNKVNQEVFVRMLHLEGITNVAIANDGVEAVEKVRNNADGSFDIIFMDVQMPNMDGIEATSTIRNELGYTGPVVAVSAFADSSNIDKCYDVGMNEFLAKPLRRPLLRKLLLDLLVVPADSSSDTK